MVKPHIHGYYSSDVDDLSTFQGGEREDIYFPLDVYIGSTEKGGADVFQIQIASPEAMRSRFEEQICVSGRHHLIVMDYDWKSIRSFLEELIASCESDNWDKVTEKLARYFHWESEDYVAAQGEDL